MSLLITSAKNPLIKQLRHLATNAKARREAGEYIAEGTHLVASYLAAGGTPIRYIYAESARDNQEITDLIKHLDGASVDGYVLTDDLFESFTNIHASVGIAVTFTPDTTSVQPTQTVVALEDIQDPGNLGTILRTAAAAGVENIALSANCASAWSPKALRAGMGAQFSLHIEENTDLIEFIKSATIPTLATTLSSTSQNLYDLDLNQPVVWIFGNEGQGVSQPIIDLASTQVHIPQADTAVESLNVAAATSICLYEQYRQLHQ